MEHPCFGQTPIVEVFATHMKWRGYFCRSGSISSWNILRANPLDPLKLHHRLQHIIAFLYNALLYSPIHVLMVISRMITWYSTRKWLGISANSNWCHCSTICAGYSLIGHGTLKVSKSMWKHRIMGIFPPCLILLRFGVLPWYLTGEVTLNVSLFMPT